MKFLKCNEKNEFLSTLRVFTPRRINSQPLHYYLLLIPSKFQGLFVKSEEGISKNSKNLMSLEFLVRVSGVEPAREAHQILSLARLPIPPYPRVVVANFTPLHWPVRPISAPFRCSSSRLETRFGSLWSPVGFRAAPRFLFLRRIR